MLVFLLANLGASSPDIDMPKKVQIWGAVLVVLQFIVIPLIIWRPSDERPLGELRNAAPPLNGTI